MTCPFCGEPSRPSWVAPYCSTYCRRRDRGMRAVVVLLVLLALAALLLPCEDAEAQLDPQKQAVYCKDTGDCTFTCSPWEDGGGCGGGASGQVSIPVPVPVVGVDAGLYPDAGAIPPTFVWVWDPTIAALLGSGFTSVESELALLTHPGDTQQVAGTVSVGNFPASFAVNDGGLFEVQGRDGGYPAEVFTRSLPLPSGAATAANQTTANTSLASIDGKLPALGQHAASGSVSVVQASDVTPTVNPAAPDGGPPPVRTVFLGCSTSYVVGQDAGTSGNPFGQLFVGAVGTYRLDTTGTCHYRLSRSGLTVDAGFANIDDPSLFIGEIERITLDGLDATLPDAGCWIGVWCEDATARFKACGPTQ